MKRKKTKIDMYVLVTQSIFTMFVLIGLGFGLGYLIDKDSVWPGIFATLFGISGIVLFIIMLLRMSDDVSG